MSASNKYNQKMRRNTLAKTAVVVAAGLALGHGVLAEEEAPEIPAWPNPPPENWVTYHLAHPGPGKAHPGDPNAAFDYKGRYHLHYIYNHNGCAYAHVSSTDMVHWVWHPTVLKPSKVGHGMYSGTGFFTKEGRPAIIYHAQGAGKNVIQFADDDLLDSWSAPIPVEAKTEDGKPVWFRAWDPDCWIMNDTYYAMSGDYSGNAWPKLMKSDDLINWTYLGDLFPPDFNGDPLGVPTYEDISCPNMFKIGHKWMLLCISHRAAFGCRYFLGDWKDEKFVPEFHAKMSFHWHHFFAPESLLTRDGRRVMWAWLHDALPIQPSGVQSLPRELELPADGVLRIRPLRELASLRYEPKARETFTVKEGERVRIEEAAGDALEMEVILATPLPEEVRVAMLFDEQSAGGMDVVYGAGRKTIWAGQAEAPFELKEGEDLALRIFIDKNLVEVFVNDRQALVYAVPTWRPDPNVRIVAKGGNAVVRSLKTWRMRSIYRPAGQQP